MYDNTPSSFRLVCEMNNAFGNKRGSYDDVSFERLEAQSRNILDEYNELVDAIAAKDLEAIRDALCDIQVFAMGTQHLLGVNGDKDMQAVVEGVMTRFVKNASDLELTKELHAKKGVVDVYTEGQFPRMILKSASDQPDAPKGKFLKSASYKNTVFPAVHVAKLKE